MAFPISTDPEVANSPVPDLATDTGTATDGGKTWSFTLKDGIKWQDGSDITCEDFKYGASRVFATDILTGGPNYLLSYLDIPTDPKTGLPKYDGPYKGDGQDLYDKAVTCDGNTITYHFNKPWPDFPLAVASLMTTDPYKKSMDKGDGSKWTMFSNGPYMIDGGTTWDKNKGATLVRNPNYDPATDSTDIRKALPDKISYQIFNNDTAADTINERLIANAGNDQCAVTPARVPPSAYARITGPVADRSVDVVSPYTDYLLPNFDHMKNLKVRQALAMATNRDAWIKAGGGDKAFTPADAITNPAVSGYQPNPAFKDIPLQGDPAGAKKLLQEAGVTLPYPITFTYPAGTTADKQAAALKQTWDAAGFSAKLDGLSDTFYDVIQKPDKKSDVIWAGWGADWPSMSTVLPPLFDSRPNFSKDSYGQDYGGYKSSEFEGLVDQASTATSLDEQVKYLQQADLVLGKDVAYIPLENAKFYMLRGSKVKSYITDPASSSYPDLGPIGVDSSCS